MHRICKGTLMNQDDHLGNSRYMKLAHDGMRRGENIDGKLSYDKAIKATL